MKQFVAVVVVVVVAVIVVIMFENSIQARRDILQIKS